MSAEDVQAKARRAAEPVLHEANSLAQTLGLGPVTPLATRTLDDFARLTQRIEADETELGERITHELSSHHHHLFLLGMHPAPKQRASNGAVAPCRCRRAPRFGAMQPRPALLRRFGSRWPPRLVIENSPVKSLRATATD